MTTLFMIIGMMITPVADFHTGERCGKAAVQFEQVVDNAEFICVRK